MATINLDQIAARLGLPPEAVVDKVMQLGRNVFRGRRHWFAGVWRREIGRPDYGGNHLHVLFHAPRGVRRQFAQRLAQLTGDPMADPHPTRGTGAGGSKFRSKRGTWDVRRAHDLPGALWYISKAPLAPDGARLSREQRLKRRSGIKEYRTFGLRRRK